MIDLLALEPNVISRDLSGKYVLLAGAEKIGKTSFCAQCPDTVIFATEIGTNALPGAMVQPINSWGDLKLAVAQLNNPKVKERFKNVAIDTIGIAFDLCERYVCASYNVNEIGDIPYGKGWSTLSKEFRSTLVQITMMGYGLIMTSHLKEIEDDATKEKFVQPDLSNRCKNIVNALVDVIGIITQEWNENGESTRWLYTKPTRYIKAGTRYRFLEPKIPFGYEELVNAIGDAIDKEVELGAVSVDKTDKVPAEVSQEYDYDDLMSRAKAVWEILITNQKDEAIAEENYNKVMSTIVKYFHTPVQISTITKDQVEPLNFAVMELEKLAN